MVNERNRVNLIVPVCKWEGLSVIGTLRWNRDYIDRSEADWVGDGEWVIRSGLCAVTPRSTPPDAPFHCLSAACLFRGWRLEAACQKVNVCLASGGQTQHTKAEPEPLAGGLRQVRSVGHAPKTLCQLLRSGSVMKRAGRGKCVHVRASGNKKISVCREDCGHVPQTILLICSTVGSNHPSARCCVLFLLIFHSYSYSSLSPT